MCVDGGGMHHRWRKRIGQAAADAEGGKRGFTGRRSPNRHFVVRAGPAPTRVALIKSGQTDWAAHLAREWGYARSLTHSTAPAHFSHSLPLTLSLQNHSRLAGSAAAPAWTRVRCREEGRALGRQAGRPGGKLARLTLSPLPLTHALSHIRSLA